MRVKRTYYVSTKEGETTEVRLEPPCLGSLTGPSKYLLYRESKVSFLRGGGLKKTEKRDHVTRTYTGKKQTQTQENYTVIEQEYL